MHQLVSQTLVCETRRARPVSITESVGIGLFSGSLCGVAYPIAPIATVSPFADGHIADRSALSAGWATGCQCDLMIDGLLTLLARLFARHEQRGHAFCESTDFGRTAATFAGHRFVVP